MTSLFSYQPNVLLRVPVSSSVYTLILFSTRLLVVSHQLVVHFSFTSTYLCFMLSPPVVTAFFIICFIQSPSLFFHPPAPSINILPTETSSIIVSGQTLSPSEPLSEESDRLTESNKPRRDAADCASRWAEVSLENLLEKRKQIPAKHLGSNNVLIRYRGTLHVLKLKRM